MKKHKKEVSILMYHGVASDKKKRETIYIRIKQFENYLKILKEKGFIPITFRDLYEMKLYNRFDRKYIILTFDDGYKDNYFYMFPLLKKYKFKAVIYLTN